MDGENPYPLRPKVSVYQFWVFTQNMKKTLCVFCHFSLKTIIIVLIVSAIIKKAICSVLFSNTVGTLRAYITRTGAVFLIVLAIDRYRSVYLNPFPQHRI